MGSTTFDLIRRREGLPVFDVASILNVLVAFPLCSGSNPSSFISAVSSRVDLFVRLSVEASLGTFDFVCRA